jgi:NCAIR mutase (PurE)-related protein
MNEPRTRPALVSNAFETSSVTVVGMNNGFGAGYAASLMNQLCNR